MQRNIHTIVLIAVLLLANIACQKNSYVENEIHGFWQVNTIEELTTNNITQAKGNLYFSFQRNTVILGHRTESKPLGLALTEQYISEFDLTNGSIRMGDFRIYMEYENKATLQDLYKFGIYDEYTTFYIERPTKNSIILSSKKARITMRKY